MDIINRYEKLNYDEAVEELYKQVPSFQVVGYSAYHPGLSVMKKFDDLLSHPHSNYKIIHIAGTNGKGSVAHFLAAALMSEGRKVGLYTSPHLLDFRERIRVNGEMIPKDAVLSFLRSNGSFISEENPSFFEVTTAMAFDWFSTSKIDIAVIETGLGGRLDSTNIVTPILSIITSIGLDHKSILGDTVEKIAVEKGGIIKEGIPIVLGKVDESVGVVIREIAQKKKSKLIDSQGYDDYYDLLSDMELTGEYQRINLKTVCAALYVLDIKFDKVKNALAHAASISGLRGRWETLSQNPRIICDIAHNQQAIQIVMKQLEKEFNSFNEIGKKYGRLVLIFGVMADKDLSSMMNYLPKEAFYYFTQTSSLRALSSNTLKNIMSENGFIGKSTSTVSEAIELYLRESKNDDLVYIGGSSYIVSDALKWYNENK